MLVEESGRCPVCKKFRDSLFSMTSRHQKRQCTPVSSLTNVRYMNTPEKVQRIQQLKSEKRLAQKRITRLQKKITDQTDVCGIVVPKSFEEDLVSISSFYHQRIINSYPEDSFQHIFWKHQVQSDKSSSTGKRWHPSMIKWCLYLRHQSSHAYEMLRKSGCIQLPSQRTLRDYTHHTSSTAGFSVDIDIQLIEDAGLPNFPEHEKYVCLIGDEMHIKEDLVFDKFSGELIGFINLGEINQHLLELENHLLSYSDYTPSLATTVFMFMVRGLFNSLKFPYAAFPAKTISADQLLPLYMEAIFRLERCGFRVVGITLDGYSANRRLMNLLSESTSSSPVKYKMKNPCTHSDRMIYFFSDPPHLLKTIRNSFASPSRNLMVRLLD